MMQERSAVMGNVSITASDVLDCKVVKLKDTAVCCIMIAFSDPTCPIEINFDDDE